MENKLNRRKFLQRSTFAAGAGLTAPYWISRAAAGGGEPVEDPTLAPSVIAPGNADTWNHKDTPEMVAAALKDIPAVPPGPFAENWASIKQNYKDPDWFRDGKFGIMMHWGIYSVPAHGSEWYVRYMYGGNKGIMDWHTEHFGPPTKFGYKDFLPMYTAAKWDPDAWAALFKKGRRQIRPRPRRTPRRFLELGQRHQPLQREELRAEARSRRRPDQSCGKSRIEDRHLRPFQLPFRIRPGASRQRRVRP